MHYYAATEPLLCLNAQLYSTESGSGFLSSWMCGRNGLALIALHGNGFICVWRVTHADWQLDWRGLTEDHRLRQLKTLKEILEVTLVRSAPAAGGKIKDHREKWLAWGHQIGSHGSSSQATDSESHTRRTTPGRFSAQPPLPFLCRRQRPWMVTFDSEAEDRREEAVPHLLE